MSFLMKINSLGAAVTSLVTRRSGVRFLSPAPSLQKKQPVAHHCATGCFALHGN